MCANIPAGGALHWLESNIQPDLIILRLCKLHLINSALFKKNLFMQVMSSHSLLSSFSCSFLAVTMKVRTDRKAHQKDTCSSQFFLIYRVRPACYGHSALPGCTWVLVCMQELSDASERFSQELHDATAVWLHVSVYLGCVMRTWEIKFAFTFSKSQVLLF